MKQIFIIPFSLLVFTSCNNNAKIEYKNRASVENKINSHPGKKLMEAKCYVCHSPSANHKNRVAFCPRNKILLHHWYMFFV